MKSGRTTSFAVALVTLVAVAGCGSDNTLSTTNPGYDAAPPSAPSNIRGESRGAISVLAWDASPDADVVGYDVYRYDPDPAREASYVKVNSTTISASEWTVVGAEDPAAWYRVKAVDLSGNRSTASGAAYVDASIDASGSVSDSDPTIEIGVRH